MLLVWLVLPTEVVGAAQAAGGMAAAASEVLNHWAGLGWAGGRHSWDLRVLSKGPGIIRIMSTNLRRVKRDQTGQDMSKGV